MVELGKFPILREEFNKIKTDMEKLAYTLKYAHQFDTKEESSKPPFWKEEWLDDIIQKVDVTRLSPEQRVFFEMSKVKIDMYHEKLEEVAFEAKKEVIKEIIIESFKEGLSTAQISKITKIPIEKVLEVIEEFSRK